MTPKEKAEELFDKYYPLVYCFMGSGMLTNTEDEGTKIKYAKQCALIAVDEIETALHKECYPNFQYEKTFEYWQQVKQEIEEL